MVQTRILSVASGLALLLAASMAAAEPVAVGFPEPGTQLTFQRTVNGESATTTWQVVADTTFEGQRVHRLESGGDFELYDAASHAWVASSRGGRLKRVVPHNGQLPAALEVGRQWRSEYLYTRRDGSEARQERAWRVAAREQVTVPAGTFDTFRIVSEGPTLTLTLWYAPAINFFVRRTTEGMVEVERVLLEYTPAGAARKD